MYADRIRNFGKAFEGRIESFLIEGALDYINFNEEPLAFEILCDHICEYDVQLSQAEYDEAITLAKDMGCDVSDGPYKHLAGLII
ncbi:MafI family immunity protein [Cronobacter sakazakii]|uniref:MafI family immunity protein n=1 Tax=Cronobacter TaxID=413496 RepID=UPI00051837D7|nr:MULTISPECIES: MafI family immunity protein [Cronobacter]EGT4268801.1 hypothetical protein [Cronobacter sakazakii]EGT4285646.1 hypothetical protein [Cronobacter sakazakii]EGT4294936.1 hypothetical protein [Cronobacter sakazakii]EGT4311767.1 hypothetical protein [Cronobacter sakazakii]EIZ2434349.1 MafI family immunity protein [Cronobacter sakazakii]